ncbi:MAG TPA: glycosyltransferase [Polyangiaceae bacterium]|jgi:glycosyltransferase involved in cell wall biosynthesis|nr:glycosyltransferase [Polyangiaceae bacterium]
MRIAIVTTSWPERADDPAGHFVRASTRPLEARHGGQVVFVVHPAPGGAFGWPGIASRLVEQPLRAPARALEALGWVARARHRVRRLDADLVVAHWAVPCAWPIGVAARGRLEVVSHGGDVRLLAALPRPLRDRLARTIARRADRWTFVSATLRDALLGSLGDAARQAVERVARVEPASIEMPDTGEAAAELRRQLGAARTAVSVGRLVASKRVDRAIEHVARSREFDALVVVGDGPERARLEHLARARRVDARFVGAVGRPLALAWIGAADALLHASEVEGLSTVVREAEALGTRVVLLQDTPAPVEVDGARSSDGA